MRVKYLRDVEENTSIQRQIHAVGRLDGDNLLIHQSWKNQLPAYTLFLILEVLVVYASITVGDSSSVSVPGFSVPLSISTLKVFPLLVLLKAAFSVLNERLVVTPTYMIHVIGRLWWRERTVRLEYGQVQEVEISQSLLQKVLGIGDLIFKPMGGNDRNSIYMKGVPQPRVVKDVIRNMKSAAL